MQIFFFQFLLMKSFLSNTTSATIFSTNWSLLSLLLICGGWAHLQKRNNDQCAYEQWQGLPTAIKKKAYMKRKTKTITKTQICIRNHGKNYGIEEHANSFTQQNYQSFTYDEAMKATCTYCGPQPHPPFFLSFKKWL